MKVSTAVADSVVLASCTRIPYGDGDENPLFAMLAKKGTDVRWEPWGYVAGRNELVILRATWDYADRPHEFLDWCASVPRLANPARLVAGNIDKRYLVKLNEVGVSTVPTVIHEIGDQLQIPSDEFVIKPVIGGGSRGAGRFSTASHFEARKHLTSLYRRGMAAIVQPYQSSVDAHGETSLVFFRGTYSHAFWKAPMLHGGVVNTGGELYAIETLRKADADNGMIALGQKCLSTAATANGMAIEDVLYARVDVVGGDKGPMILELELTEPSLGLRYGGIPAYCRFAEAIASMSSGR
jgi:hypothetical protein